MRIYGQEIKPQNRIMKTINRIAVQKAPLGMISDPLHFANISTSMFASRRILNFKDRLDRITVMITEPKSSPIAAIINKACQLIKRR